LLVKMEKRAMQPPAREGFYLDEIDTPALVVDLDAMEVNLDLMARKARSANVRLRPHAKMHKSPWIGREQISRGAIGVCCQKVSEAEVMVTGGIKDILISNQVVGTVKLDRLAILNREAKVAVCIDHADAVGEISASAKRADVVINTLVEIDVGAGRCGTKSPKKTLELAQAIANEPTLKFGGIQAYHGAAQHFRAHDERQAAIMNAIAITNESVSILASAGLDCDTVGGAGTGTFEFEAASHVYNELQCGSYAFMDADYARNKQKDGTPYNTFHHALFILTTVMSRPDKTTAVVDAGHKAASVDSGFPRPWHLPGAQIQGMSDDHGVIDITRVIDKPARGQKLLLVPGHCDPTVNLHDWYVGVRGLHGMNGFVEAIHPVAARGAYF